MNLWSTASPDWESRLFAGRPLVPDLPGLLQEPFRSEAEKALRIFKRLRLPDVFGKPTMAEAAGEWFFAIVAALFGSYDARIHRRMIQEVFLLVPKKNSKSSGSAMIMLTALIMNRRSDGEFLLVAPTKEIADISYKQAAGAIKLDPALEKLFHPQRHLRLITHRNTSATLQIKAADEDVITGGKQVGSLIDETHVFAGRSNAAEIFVEVRGALAARPDGFMIQISTQSKKPPAGVFKAELGIARDVRDGKLVLPLLPVIYELPERLAKDGGWKDRRHWPLVNPNLGRSVDVTFLENELIKAEREGAAHMALFASQHFNVEIGVGLRSGGWAGAEYWDRGIERGGLTLQQLLDRSEVVTIGIDGGGLDDLLGLAVIGRETTTRRWLLWAHAFISPEGWERRKANIPLYEDFIAQETLTKVDALPKDLTALVEIVKQVDASGLLAFVGVDKHGIGGIVDALAEINIVQDDGRLGGVPQGIALMGAIKTIERKLADGSFRHGGQAMMAWCAGNAQIVPTPTAIRIDREASGYGKIDPLMAAFDAASLMMTNPPAQGRSYIDTAEELLLLA